MTCGEIVARCDALGCEVVEVTGGEPLCQPECAGLVTCLLEKGYTVLVETNGSVPIVPLPSGAIRIMDLKCPGSGMAEKNDWTNIQALGTRDEIKFVISDRSDYEWARGIVAEHGLCERCNAVLFSPVFGVLDASSLASWIVEDGLKVRLQIQLHKCIWPHEQRGV